MTIIETPRLRLRRWREADLEPLIRMNADPQVMRFFPEAYSEERTRQFYSAVQDEFSQFGYGLYAAEEKSGGRFMGFIGFHHANFEADFCPCVEIGWRLDKQFWNKGYATEGARACLEYGFGKLGLDEVYSFTAVINTQSRRVMQKLGMNFHQHFLHPGVAEGHVLRPHVCYAARRE